MELIIISKQGVPLHITTPRAEFHVSRDGDTFAYYEQSTPPDAILKPIMSPGLLITCGKHRYFSIMTGNRVYGKCEKCGHIRDNNR